MLADPRIVNSHGDRLNTSIEGRAEYKDCSNAPEPGYKCAGVVPVPEAYDPRSFYPASGVAVPEKSVMEPIHEQSGRREGDLHYREDVVRAQA